MNGKNQIYMLWFYLFLGSFFLGVFLMNMGNETLLTEEGIFSVTSVNRLKYIEIDNGRFLRYVLRQRMGEGAALILLSTTGIGLTAIYIWVIWQGVLAGMTITAAIIRDKGAAAAAWRYVSPSASDYPGGSDAFGVVL